MASNSAGVPKDVSLAAPDRYPGDVIEIVLLLGLIGLFVVQRRTNARLARLEALIAGKGAEPAPQAAEGPLLSEADLPPAPARQTLGGLFEQVVGGRMLIWIGGVALAAAGMFLIRHSIELVTPGARMIAAASFGILLLAAGEYARAGRLFAGDPRTGQALVGAGIAVLYATAYGSYILFGLIGSGTTSALMLAITAVALGLSLRHGAPTALMGLAGGFLTPLLVGDARAGALPVLSYLTLLDFSIFFIAAKRRWLWLATAAVAGSFAWSGYFILEPVREALLAGVFAASLGLATSLQRAREGRQLSLMQPVIISLFQLAILVGRGDVGLPAWLLFGALAAASLPLAVLRPEQRFAMPAALALALAVIASRAVAADPFAPIAAAAATLLFAVIGSALPGRERPIRAFTACLGLAGPLLVLRFIRPELMNRPSWGMLAIALAVGALLLLLILRKRTVASYIADAAAFAAGATATLLLALAAYDLIAREFVSGGWLLIAISLLVFGVRLRDKGLRLAGLILLTVTTLRVFLLDAAELEGVLRIFSFLGLGIALIGIGKLYSKVLIASPGKSAKGSAPAEAR